MPRNVVGARELKTRLGTYLRRVREGNTLLVTDRGEPVAELRPIAAVPNTNAALIRLSKIGALSLRGADPCVRFARSDPKEAHFRKWSTKIVRTDSDAILRCERPG
jgi:prevent-host-death family protein